MIEAFYDILINSSCSDRNPAYICHHSCSIWCLNEIHNLDISSLKYNIFAQSSFFYRRNICILFSVQYKIKLVSLLVFITTNDNFPFLID